MEAKRTLGAMRSAVKVDDQYGAWDLDDAHNRDHAFRPERLKVIAAIVDEEKTPAEKDAPILQARINRLEAEKAELVEACKYVDLRLADYATSGAPDIHLLKEMHELLQAALAKVQPPRMNATIQADPTDPDFECSMSPGCPCDNCQKENVKMD